MNTPLEIPKDIDAEKALLGCCLIRKNSFYEISSKINDDDFYSYDNIEIWKSIKLLNEKGYGVDFSTVASDLTNRGAMSPTLDMAYILSLTSSVPSTQNILTYAERVLEKSERRKLINLGAQIQQVAFDMSKDEPGHLVKGMVIDSLKERKDVTVTFDSALLELTKYQLRATEARIAGRKCVGIPTYDTLDRVTDGIDFGKFWLVAAYASTGKSQFMMNLLIKCLNADVPVQLYSLEMSPANNALRLLSMHSGVNMTNVKYMWDKRTDMEMSKQDKAAYENSIQFFKDKKDLFSIKRSTSLDEIQGMLLEAEIKKSAQVVLIDYAQLVNGKAKETETDTLDRMAKWIQDFTVRSGITVIMLSQVSQEAQKFENRNVYSAKGSGTLGASADIFITLRNDITDKDIRDKLKWEGHPIPISIDAQKNRDGLTASIPMMFDTATGRMYEPEQGVQYECYKYQKGEHFDDIK